MNSSNVEEIITCGICLETFNGYSRCPRILNCGHSFCHLCLEKLIVQSPCCPTCKRGFRFKKAASIHINFSLKSLTDIKTEVSSGTISSKKALGHRELDSSSLESSAAKPHGTKSKSFLSEGHCDEHNIYLGMRCMDCEVWICAMCGMLHHRHCRTLVVEDAYVELKNKLAQKVATELGERNATFVRVDESLRILDEERKCLIEEIKKKEQKLKDCEKRVREFESIKSDGRKFCKKLEQLHGLVESSAIGELSKAIKELEKLLIEPRKETPDNPPYLHKPSPSLSIPLPMTLSKKQLENWCSTGPVYAEEDRFIGTKYGKVTIKDGRILVHNFQTEKPQARIIPFKEITKFEASTELSNTAFLRLTSTDGGTESIDLLIQTDGTSPRAMNFLLLCSALKGRTYKGMSMELKGIRNVVCSYCYTLAPGPFAVVEGIKPNDAVVNVRKAGVYGMSWESDSWFLISWSHHPSQSYREIGFVISGFQDLIGQEGSLKISDCGLVI